RLTSFEGNHPVSPEPVPLDSFVSEVIASAQTDPSFSGYRIEHSAEPGLRNTAVDRGRMKEVLLNLLINAREAQPEGGVIRTTVRSEGRRLVLSVEDEGTGMDPETAERCFEPYFSTKERGSGLGLSVVMRIVKAHGGTIRVRSAPNAGTSVDILLPVRDKGKEAE
ncbi:PAS domain-containing sensor histidine kinase, partial [Planctomycetota bacterium]